MKKKQRINPKLVGIFDKYIDKDAPPPKPAKPETREIPRQLVMFWRREKCLKCHRVYEGSLYHSQPLLLLEVQTKLVYFGREFGWKYKGTEFRPVADTSLFDHLPHTIETCERTVRVCPRCIHIPKVIYLTQETA